MTRNFLLALAVVSTVFAAACGEGSRGPTAPTVIEPPPTSGGNPSPPAAPTTTTFQVVSGENMQPVPGATVTIAGQTLTADGAGSVTLQSASINERTEVTIEAPGFLQPRETIFGRDRNQFTLWALSGVDESFIHALVYNGGSILARIEAPVAYVYVPRELADPGVIEAFSRAAQLLTAANGNVRYEVTSTEPSPSDVVIRVTLGNSRPEFAAFASPSVRGSTVVGAIIEYQRREFLTSFDIARHELGHTLRLGHANGGVMAASGGYGLLDYSVAEKQVMRAMFRRRSGNRFPDNDRSVMLSTMSAGESSVAVCELPLPPGS